MPAKPDSRMRKGSAMAAVAAVIIVIVMMMFLSKLAASRAAVASARQKADRAATSARSGAELLLYIFQQIADSNQLPAGYDQAQLAEAIKSGLADLEIQGVAVVADDGVISVSSIILEASTAQSFTARITDESDDSISVEITGRASDVPRRLQLRYSFRTGSRLIFDPDAST